MKNIFRFLLAALLIAGAVTPGKAEMYKYGQTGNNGQRAQTAAGCTPSSAFEWLDINNVRTRINAGGDMWWDLPSGTGSKYFIPANGSATSLFAGSLWIAGVDVNNQLKCAALRFRQVGNDYYTGPLTVDGKASITPETCAKWDKIFKITRAEVDEFLANYQAGNVEEIPSIIANWPAIRSGDDPEGIAYYLAPFYDADGDGDYNPANGDYPYYDITNELCHTKIPTMEEEVYGTMHGSILADQVLKGDQTLWWIFNDKGAAHTESGGQAIGIEVRAQAFAFATNDEINNMTFYSYEIINRSTYTLTGTYFSPWTDVDLGYGYDDYVGCDVERGLGYGYNGAYIDGSGEPEAYGAQPPALGIDFFQGPYMDADGIDNPKYETTIVKTFDHIDPATNDSIFTFDTVYGNQMVDESINGVNFGNGIIDDERFGMRRFVYHNNSSADNGDPSTAPQYYNYLRGIWKNGAKMRYGGDAFSSSDVVGPECDFMFPGDSDPWNWGTGGNAPNGGFNTGGKYWTEEQCGNAPNDRRFMQSAGPFTLEPGAVNYITFGVPWARATSGGAWASVELLRVVDDKCQALFDNCFKVIDGPSAPDLTIRELDQKLIIYLSNGTLSNNYKEGYIELDPEIPTGRTENELVAKDTTWYISVDGDSIYQVEEKYQDTTYVYDRYYRFEGYKVYQLANAEVGADELNNNDKARLVFQCDVRNNVGRLLNYEFDESLQANVPFLKVNGGDAGITHSFVVTEDEFSTSDNPNLINHTPYYYMAVAYAYNNYLTYNQDDALGLQGQKKPYLEGRKNIQVYTAIPHMTINGTVLQSHYGDSPAITRVVGAGNGYTELELSQASIDEIMSKRLADGYTEDENHNPVFIDHNPDINEPVLFGNPNYPACYHPTYEPGYGPIDVKIIDPLNVKSHNYELVFDEMFEKYTQHVTNNPDIRGDSAARMVNRWWLRDLDEPEEEGVNPIPSDTTTIYDNEQLFIDRGISVSVTQVYQFGRIWIGKYYNSSDSQSPWKDYNTVVATNNGVVGSSIEYTDPSNQWMSFIRDIDVPDSYLNWIRSGSYVDMNNASYNDYQMSSQSYGGTGSSKPWDPNENWEKIASRAWTTPLFATYSGQGGQRNPGPGRSVDARIDGHFKLTTSIDIVFTADKSKWTRCPVIEMGMDKKLNENGVDRFYLRKHASVDKDGNPYMLKDQNNNDSIPFNLWLKAGQAEYASANEDDPNFIAPQGMGWFPGYVIDVENGVRLNVAFGEDSYLEDMGGRDMIFNPAKVQKATAEDASGLLQEYDPAIFRGADNDPVFGGKHFVYIWRMDSIAVDNTVPWKYLTNYGYDGGQLLFNSFNALQHMTEDYSDVVIDFIYQMVMWMGMPMGVESMEWLPEGNDCRIRIRLAKPYAPGYGYPLQVENPDLNVNNMNPKYIFSIEGWDPVQNDPKKTDEDLNLITVVPNPYYAYNSYEGNALTNKVKITNLPNKCIVSIYTLSGTKVRQFRKDNEEPSIDWDLTNFANTPVASGFYLIHIKDLTSGGERTIKFFGAMRQVDLNTF